MLCRNGEESEGIVIKALVFGFILLVVAVLVGTWEVIKIRQLIELNRVSATVAKEDAKEALHVAETLMEVGHDQFNQTGSGDMNIRGRQ